MRFHFKIHLHLRFLFGTFTVDWICVNFHHNKKKTSHDSSCFPTRNNGKALNKAKTFTFSKALAEANFSRMTVIYVTFNSREYSESAVFFFFASRFDTVWLLVCAKRYIELFNARCKHKNSCFSVNILRAHQKCEKYWDWLTPHLKKIETICVTLWFTCPHKLTHTGREREREETLEEKSECTFARATAHYYWGDENI